jgi:putative tryptophan/tyrosine transport system substrate-binding protein
MVFIVPASKVVGMRCPSLLRLHFGFAVFCAVSLASCAAFAQPHSARRPVIGVLSPFLNSESSLLQDLRAGLARHGLRDGQEITIEYRSAEGNVERLPTLAQELVRLKVDVLVTASAPAIRFLQQATQTIPIVMARVGDAVDQGFVASLARPGGNITGSTWLAPELSAKRLELLKEAFPELSRVGVLREASASASSVTSVRATARRLGIDVIVLEVRSPEEFGTALSAMSAAKVEAVEIPEGLMIFNNVRTLVAIAKQHALPVIFPDVNFVEAGGLMSYGPDFSEIQRRTADIVEKILRGSDPRDIPVEQPTRFRFAVNLNAARALSLTIPSSVIVRADLVIE